VVFPVSWWCRVFTVTMGQSSFNLLGSAIRPSNLTVHTLLGWLDLLLELMVSSMVLRPTSTQITCIGSSLYLQLVSTCHHLQRLQG
jgi:hypothetical protein